MGTFIYEHCLGNNMGQAYGFFQCEDAKSTVDAALQDARPLARIGSDISVTLYEIDEFNPSDPTLKELSLEAYCDGNNYMIECASPAKPNHALAIDARTLINQLHQSDLRMGRGGGVAYKEGTEYIVKTNNS